MNTKILLLLFLSLSSVAVTPQDPLSEDQLNERATAYLSELQKAFREGDYSTHKIYSDSLYMLGLEQGSYKYQILGMVNQGVNHNNAGEPTEAIERYRTALALADSIPEDHRTKIIVLVNLGNTYTNMSAHEKAIETMQTVVNLLDTREDNPRIRAAAYNGIANNYENLDNDTMALEYHHKARKLGEEIEDESVVATAMNNISGYYLKNKEYAKAKETLELTLNLEPTQKPTKQRASLLLSMGQALVGLGETNEAISYYKESLELAHEKGLSAIEIDVYKYLQQAYEQLGDSANADIAKANHLQLTTEFLEQRESATKMDLEKDLSEKNAIIAERERIVQGLEARRTRLLLWSSLLALILIVLGVVFVQYRKRIKRENTQLREQFVNLKSPEEIKTGPEQTNTGPEQTNTGTEKTKTASYKNSSLTPEDFDTYRKQLLAYMETERPYLNPELSQSDLAQHLGIGAHHLSEILNNGFNQNFYNFINSYRVLQAQKIMQKDSVNESKILAVAFDSGFKSKTSFNRVFKNHTGMTPSEYRKKLT